MKSDAFSRTTMWFLALEHCSASYFTEELILKWWLGKSKMLHEKCLLVAGRRDVASFLMSGWPHTWSKSRWKRDRKILSCGEYILNRGCEWKRFVPCCPCYSMLEGCQASTSLALLEQKSPWFFSWKVFWVCCTAEQRKNLKSHNVSPDRKTISFLILMTYHFSWKIMPIAC